MNERITENIVRDELDKKGYRSDETITIEEQKSQNPIIQKCLKNASKSGKGSGKPEFLIQSAKEKDFIIIVECKADVNKHQSANLDKYADFAVDGVLNYAAYLSKEFNVIAIAVSGQSKDSLKISTFLWVKQATTYKPLVESGKPVEKILPFSKYITISTSNPDIEKKRYEDLIAFSRELHNYVRDYAKLSGTEKPLLVSGTLMALQDKAFGKNYRDFESKILSRELLNALKREIESADLPKAKVPNLLQPYSFMTVHPELAKFDKQANTSPLQQIVSDIETHVKPFITAHHHFDVLGQFYGEFLRYANGDKSLGIVLTPKHIAELFAKIANLTPQDTVLDICTGTGGFLISSMVEMTKKAKSDDEVKRIKAEGLVGVEQQPNMFALAASNMILRGDGKANLFQGSCFDAAITKEIKSRNATVGMMNPPFSQKGEGLSELDFALHLLGCLKEGATGIIIVPISCAIEPSKQKEKLLENHTLEAVMSMPNDLFHPINVVTCIMVFTAHKPHNSNPRHKTWFGYWRDDGFIKTKHQGRIDSLNRWEEVEEKWLSAYANRDEILGLSVKHKVTAKDEWCAEAYMETDYSSLTEQDFMKYVKDYILFSVQDK